MRDLIIKNNSNSNNLNSYSIFDFLTSQTIKIIPDYQRPYTWDENNVEELFDDILHSAKNNSKWFLGPLFTSHRDQDFNELELLDGQQRITTIILFLRCYSTLHLSEEYDYSHFDAPVTQSEEKATYRNLNELIINQLLITRTEDLKKVSKFRTDISVREKFNHWILDAADSEAKYDSIKDISATKNDEFLPTLQNLNTNINWIYNKYEGILSKKNGLKKLNLFINHLISHTDIIQVPLKSSEDILDIFESINNRGKQLNLSDLIRFKTLSKISSEEENSELYKKIQQKWHSIFRMSQALVNKGIFDNLNEFLERFINSISDTKSGYTSDSKRIKHFMEFYDNENSHIENGVDDIHKVLSLLNHLIGNKEDSFRNLFSSNPSKYKKINFLLEMLTIALQASKNAQVTFFSFLRNMYDKETFEQNDYDLISTSVFEFIKLIISLDIYQKIDSNERRNIYIDYSIQLRENAVLTSFYDNLPDASKITGQKGKFIQNIILIKHSGINKKYNELILYLFQFYKNYENFPEDILFKNRNTEHIIPDKWYLREEWKSVLSEKELKNAISEVTSDLIKEALNSLLEGEGLWNNQASKESFIQLIGNKIMIYDSQNIKMSNLPWKDFKNKKGNVQKGKKQLLTDFTSKKGTYLPNNQKLEEIESFNAHNVVKTSEEILNTIFENQNLKYKSVNS